MTSGLSSTPENLPVKWRRKLYIRHNHTIAGYNSESVDRGTSGPSTGTSLDPTTGPSTGPCACKVQKLKLDASVQTDSEELVKYENSDVQPDQESAPTTTSVISPLPPVVTSHALNCEELACKLGFMQKKMKEGWNTFGEPAEKENVVPSPLPPPRPLKRKRDAPQATSVEPVRRSKRLLRKAQGGDKE